jgi:hypothetical protein
VRFSLFLVCGYSHMVWIEGLKTKAEAAAAFEKWVVKVNAESPLPDIRVSRLHTDNGGEFVAKIFGDVCLRYGIVQTFTQPDCPSQNPFAERNIGSINSLALTAMVTANSPRDQWWLAQNNAVNILNMFPKEGESISPHEYYYQRVPDLTMQLPWGCLCVAYRSKRLNGICPKWTAGSVKGTYAGVSNHKGRHGYTVIWEDGKSIHTSVAVKADRQYFPNRAPGDERITGWNFNSKVSTADPNPYVALLQQKSAGGDDYVLVPRTKDVDDEEYDFVNDPRFQFDDGNVTAGDIIDQHIIKEFLVDCEMVPCRGTCVSLSIDSDSGEPLVGILFDDGDECDLTYLEFASLKIREETAFFNGTIPQMVDGFSAVDAGPDVVSSRREMLQQPDFKEFLAAEKKEIANMEKNGVLQVMALPDGVKAIGSKFVYKRKHGKTGELVERKARIVAKGFQQRAGIDFLDTSAPVAGVTGFRMLVCTALIRGWRTYSWDVTAAFLHPDLLQAIYMRAPDGYPDMPPGMVFLLKKTIYGLKQSANEWHALLSRTFRDL